MAAEFRISNIAEQIGRLGNKLPTHVMKRWDKGYPAMLQDAGVHLGDLIQKDVFQRQSEPDGKSWTRISPLTLAVRKGLSIGGGVKLGGMKLPQSFMVGGAKNIFKKTRQGFSLGSGLKKKSHLVGRTFGLRFKMPKDANNHAKAAKIRAFMGGVTGIHAPAPGKQLTHPARRLVYWTPKWEKEITTIAVEHLIDSYNSAIPEVAVTVKGIQKMNDAKQRVSVVG